MISEKEIKELNLQLKGKKAEESIEFFLNKFGKKITFATSMGAEDQVITQMITGIDKSANIFTLDTGRLFQETYDLIDITNKKYGININLYFPEADKVEDMVHAKGINLFYDSVENRKMCCHIRKIEPKKRAFQNMDAWISGLRQEQSITRFNTNLVEWDETNDLIKINPLFNWAEQQVWDYIKENNIPYHKLHDQAYPSIGCQPCTRTVQNGDEFRAGRWWWEASENKECGLHTK